MLHTPQVTDFVKRMQQK